MIGMTLFFLFTIGFVNYFLYRDTKRFSSAYEELDLERIIPFLEEKGGNHLSHLIILQDKDVYWAQDGRVLIAYKKIGNKLVVLGDPIGEESSIQAAIREFNEYSKSIGLTPVFYQISPRFMHYYHDTGYRFLKLGEEAIVSLDKFTLEGKQGARLRTRLNKFNRNSYTFNVIHPPYSNDLLSELRVISDSWLGEQKEKGFSVVSFSEEYVSCFPIACVSDPEGNIVAFATLANDYKKTMTIDLMRKSSDSPHGTMDVLFIHIFKWAKERGYKRCSLGMSPLAHVGDSPFSFKKEKLARLAYLHGNSFYNFKGLKEFKSKFACTWEPKYLAYKKSFLPIAVIQLLLLINSQPHPKYVIDKIKYLFKNAG